MKKGEDFVGVTIVYLCHDGKGNILLNKRSKNCRDEHGAWDPGGGGLEFGDTVIDTLKKEIKEEYCVDVISKSLPSGLEKCPHKEIIDIYIPASSAHPVLRIRRKGNAFEMTKKEPTKDGDASEQTEHTIKLTEEEFKALAAIEGKRSRKTRYDYPYQGHTAEIAVFKDGLDGLVLIDFEFKDVKSKDAFKMPDFCLADVTQDDTFAGGMLCGKKYGDIEEKLRSSGYKPIHI